MSWDTWQIPVADIGGPPEAKRPRLDAFPCNGMAFGVPGCMTGWQQPPAPPLTMATAMAVPGDPRMGMCPQAAQAPTSDLTREIMDALRSRSRPAPPAPAADTPELGSLLLNSLRMLMPNGHGLPGSGESQELFRVVQRMSSAPPAPAPAPVAEPSPPPAASPEPDEAPPVAASSQAHRSLDADRPPLVHLGGTKDVDDDAESDDGVPHRLPPGFGAIPEDIVEERARQREEQRILQLKATQPCRFGKRCKKRDCPNAHPEGRDIDTAWNPCAFGRRCKRKGCFYDHPEGREIDDNPEKGMCKFGVRCSRPDCLYDHPEGRAALTGADPRICFFCHDPGHIAGDCPRNPESWNFNREVPGQVVQVPPQRAIAT